MPFKDLREFMARLDELGELHRVKVEVSPELEISAITDRLCKLPGGGPALLFSNVAGTPFPVATNLFGSAARMAAMLEQSSLDNFGNWLQELFQKLSGNSADEKLAALKESDFGGKFTPVRTHDAPFLAVKEHPPDLRRFPVLKNWPGDGKPCHQGRFLTLPLVITADPEYSGLNCGMYRVALLSQNQAAVNWSPHSGGAAHMAEWQTRSEPMPVAIALGGDPMVTYCATLPLPPSVNEFWFAGLLRGEPVELAQCRTSGLLVPAGAEMVIEGILIPGETTPSGAFGNHTGYYAPSKDAPLLRVTAISRRRDMILPATVVGPPPMEDCWFAEATSRLLLALVQADLPFVISLDRPQAGIFHGGTIITVDSSLDKPGNGLLASLMASQFLAKARLLVMVDYGQDPHDYSGVYWRIINNSDWKRDLVIAGDRLGIDATCKPRGNIAEGVPQEHVRMARDIEQLVSQRWNEYGFK